jgi:hypothetical protein
MAIVAYIFLSLCGSTSLRDKNITEFVILLSFNLVDPETWDTLKKLLKNH